jgi:hypothetical protein
VESEGYNEIDLNGSTFHILLPTRTEASDPRIAKLFGQFETLKPELETGISDKENSPTNSPTP